VARRASTIEALRNTALPLHPHGRHRQTSSFHREMRRRSQPKKAASPSPMRKAKPAGPSIVPPINVLIVECVLSLYMSRYDPEDIQMPVTDSISATKEIRRSEKLNASQGYPGTPQTEGQHIFRTIPACQRAPSVPRSSLWPSPRHHYSLTGWLH